MEFDNFQGIFIVGRIKFEFGQIFFFDFIIYCMFYNLSILWLCFFFDIICDGFGDNCSVYFMIMYIVVGIQVENIKVLDNFFMVMKLSVLSKM